MSYNVFIGVGHGGKDPGATANGLKEKDLNLAIAKACNEELVRHDVTVKMSRAKDEDSSLAKRIKQSNEFKADYAVDIHNNAGGGDGVEVYYQYSSEGSKKMANAVLEEIVKIGQNSRGIRTRKNSKNQDYYGFLRDTDANSIIIECAFVDNKKDIQIIDTTAEQKAMGVAIAKGILKTLGIAYINAPKQQDGILYRVQVGAFYKKENADDIYRKLKTAGFSAYIVKVGAIYKVQVGAYVRRSNADTMAMKLKAAGFNTHITTKSGSAVTVSAKKSIDEIAKEVIKGKWGTGEDRKNRLTKAGYSYKDVQKRVNELL